MMVSNVQNSAQSPPLSYADRVKKSQRANAAPSTSGQRPHTRAQPSVAPNAAKATRQPVAEPPALLQPQGAPPAPVDRQPSSPDTPRKAMEQPPVNGQAGSSSIEPVAGPSSATAKKVTAPPAVNVWSVRREQMARAHSQQTVKNSDPPSQAPVSSGNHTSPPPPLPTATGSSSAATSAQKEPEPSSSTVPPKSVAAEKVAHNEEDDDPWVVRPNRAPAAVPLPRLLDSASWPEVGKAPVSGASQPGGSTTTEKEEKQKRETQGNGQRRAGEKPKWVPIPPEELRAAADAQRTTQSSVNSRSQSQQRAHGSSPGSASRSTQGSQERSKASVGRGQSALGSASHSAAHSRSGSVQSSPKNPSTRLRRIPDDGSQSRRSSRANSPRPYPGPPVLPVVPAPDASQMEMPQPVSVNGTAYYPPVPHVPSPFGVSTPPYPPPGSIPPVYNPAYAPYAPYPAYPPPAGQPYMYWGMPQDPRHPYPVSSQSQSPATHPSSLARSQDATPLTSVGPSPGEERPEQAAAATSGAKDVSKETQKPSRRQRLLSFGSIRADGAIMAESDEIEGTPSNTAESGTLGLSLESLSISNGADVTPRTTEHTVQEAVVSMDVAKAEAGASIRHPQAPGSAPFVGTSTAVPPAGTAPGVINGDEQSVSDQAASSRLPIEFGTTGQAIVADELSASQSAAPVQPTPEVAGPSSDLAPEGIPLRVRLSPLGAVVNAEGLPPTPVPASAGGALYANNSPVNTIAEGARDDELRVRDFGFGFGRGRYDGSYAARDDRTPKDRPYYGGRSAPRPYEEGGYRRGFGGRRGRGSSRGYGRGGRGGGRDYAGGRGSYPRYPPREMEYEVEDPMAYGVPPVDPAIYYGPPVAPAGYVPPAFDMYAPYGPAYPLPPVPAVTPTAPVPTPVTKLSFPLDPTRYYLLGQLEYYLSEDNMAQDFYLRKHMDARGWISVMLLASFPRVKSLTYDLQLVKDVLTLSSLVEVRSDWVRPYKWGQYVLPGAAASVVDAGGSASGYTSPSQVDVEQLLLQHPPSRPALGDGEGPLAAQVHVQLQTIDNGQENAIDEVHEYEDDEDEDEDDVVFVLGKDAGRAWTPERKADSAA